MSTHHPVPVLYLITELDAGGAQSALFGLIARTDESQFKITVACFYNGDKLMAKRIRDLGVSVIDLRMMAVWRVDALWRLYTLLRREKPVILHSWLFHANILGRIIGHLAKVPLIITSRRNVEIGGMRRERLKQWTSSFDDKIIAVCEEARQAEIQRTHVSPSKVITIYNGIESDRYVISNHQIIRREFGIAPESPLLGIVGRLHPQKGHSDLISAFALVKKQVPGVQLLIIGDGCLRRALEEETKQNQVADGIIFTGLRNDIPSLLSAIDLFVLPSLWEGLPNVVLEAMAAGLPVVATAVGGMPELVVENETGILVPPHDPEALAVAIIDLLANTPRMNMMGKSGRQRAQKCFSMEKTVYNTHAVYTDLLAQMELH